MPRAMNHYRVVRLAIHVPLSGGDRAPWSLICVGHRGGIPHASVLLDGTVALRGPAPTTEEILEAIDSLVRQSML